VGVCRGGVPVTDGGVVELLEKRDDVPPRKSSDGLSDDCILGPRGRKGAHRVDVRAPEPGHFGELCSQVCGELVDDLRAPPRGFLADADGVPDPPVQPQELGVHHAVRAQLS